MLLLRQRDLLSAVVRLGEVLGEVELAVLRHDALHLHFALTLVRPQVHLILVDPLHSRLQLVQESLLGQFIDVEGELDLLLLDRFLLGQVKKQLLASCGIGSELYRSICIIAGLGLFKGRT